MHKNSQKRIYGDYIYFITCTVGESFQVFYNRILCDLWMQVLILGKVLQQFKLFAFCLNYDHFHLLIKPNNKIANYSKIMQFLKRHFTRNANIILGYDKHCFKTMGNKKNEGDIGFHPEGDIGQYRLREHEYREKWQIEMDKFVIRIRNKFLQKYGTNHNIPKFRWQKSFHDHVIRDQCDYDNHWNYTMYNYKKHGLLENWQYTGLNYPEMIDEL
jgi:REP element-mobilizing transposase RayT